MVYLQTNKQNNKNTFPFLSKLIMEDALNNKSF